MQDADVTQAPDSPAQPSVPKDVAVIGAGFAGLACARELADAGVRVSVFDEGRGAGGRCSTRRVEAGGEPLQFDHGAQYFIARSLAFRQQLASWVERGVAAAWTPKLVEISDGRTRRKTDQPLRHVGVPGMSALLRDLEEGLDVRHSLRVTALERATGWTLTAVAASSDDGSDEAAETLGPFDAVAVAVPGPQAARLLDPLPALRELAEGARMAPCLAILLAFDRPLEVGYDAAFVHGSALSWAARDSSKPGRPEAETWVLHATTAWSERHLRDADDEVIRAALSAWRISSRFEPPPPRWASVHRWRFARVPEPLDRDCLWDPAARVGACGDWCAGERVERAWESGRALARRMLGEAAAD